MEGTIAKGGTSDDAMAGKLLNAKKQWEVQEGAWGVLELVYPKPGMCWAFVERGVVTDSSQIF